MNRDDILRMAREAHTDLVTVDYPGHAGQLDPWTLRLLERFAALVEQHLIESGYRKCAVGQRTTQFCGQLEKAVEAERSKSMSREEEMVLRELAAGRFVSAKMVETLGTMSIWSKNSIAREIGKAVAAEREACARIVDDAQPFGIIATTAAAIRARGANAT